ncbi:cobyrinic acid a,c-diamide synthase [Nocardioides sp. YR527]|uniref:cobyrinate a,c-diamide synthase n=1 Tax=Nocardioides sp. YR527 TaxID=1881028 RepID=UPI00088F8F66|nr:cobyrinate a,c-diamide synthase [Nocardioides sp. YR527]SDK68968.1 cobyrinic acid a,c-diamide synthase [Nocardioides sp. YR527]
MVTLPRLVVAAPSTGSGKTTIATGLMAALRASGMTVSGHKVGPDYIDPGYHALATGRPGRNLDPHLVGVERVVPLLLHGAAGADVAVIEGVMGLYDGRLGTDGFASTAHVSSLTSSPVVLVLDVARMSRSAAAIAAGMATFDPSVRIGGVVLNRCSPGRNAEEIRRALEQAGLPVLGLLPRDESLATPSRHLGLVPVAERDESVALIERLGEQVAAHLDLSALMDVASSAPALEGEAWDPAKALREDDRVGLDTASIVPHDAGSTDVPTAGRAAGAARRRRVERRIEPVEMTNTVARPVVAFAGGRAFTFRYPETEELLEAAGCDVRSFDPLTDPTLPEGTSGIYLGGGFPEMYAADLAANHSLLRDLRAAVEAGVPTVAECAGLLYLAESLDGVPMAGAIPTHAAMSERLTLRYPVATAVSDSILTRAGEQVTGHEFHRTTTSPPAGTQAAWTVDGAATGFAGRTLHAAYLHVHWAGHPHLARRFADAAHSFTPVGRADVVRDERRRVETNTVPSSATGDRVGLDTPPPSGSGGSTSGVGGSVSGVADPLRHHGDVEVGEGLLDFAVNVYPGPRPEWLDRTLHESLAPAAYPDEEPARAALAKHHGRDRDEVLPTAGAAEAFTLVARARQWRKPVVVHPQFTEPHAALEQAGHRVTEVRLRHEDGFSLDPAAVPEDADLVVVGNPTNPTGVLHPTSTLRALLRPGRLVVVDEAFMDAVPGEPETLTGERTEGLLVIRSLTKHWSIPGVRAGYVVGDAAAISDLEAVRTPWSVSATAAAAMLACATERASAEARERAERISTWRDHLETGLRDQQIEYVPSAASFVLARPGAGVREALREEGIAVRRADTFPGLGSDWVRIAVRPEDPTDQLLAALRQTREPS